MIFASDWGGQGLFQSLNKTKIQFPWIMIAYTYYVPATIYNRNINELSHLITTHVRCNILLSTTYVSLLPLPTLY